MTYVWQVESGEYEAIHTIGIYSTRENAIASVKALYNVDAGVTEYEWSETESAEDYVTLIADRVKPQVRLFFYLSRQEVDPS